MLSNSKGLEFRLGYHSLIGALSKVLGVSTWIPLTHRSAFEGAWSFDLEAMRGHGMGLNTS